MLLREYISSLMAYKFVSHVLVIKKLEILLYYKYKQGTK